MSDFPKTLYIKRGGKLRLAIFTQLYIHKNGCYDTLRLAWISL